MRANDSYARTSYSTPRTLLAILRFSQAIARIHFRDQVQQCDVDEAIHLMEASKASMIDAVAEHSVHARRYTKGQPGRMADVNSKIFTALKDIVRDWGNSDNQVAMNVVYENLKSASFSHDQIGTFLDDFCRVNLIKIENDQLVMF